MRPGKSAESALAELAGKCAEALETVRQKRPLVHNITNYVVMNFTANVLLCTGASPVMAHAVEEVEEMVSIANALVLNIGTLSRAWIEAMLRAGRRARSLGVPIILDPVGAGATRLRTDASVDLLEQVRPVAVRGNASEIIALARGDAATRGVDSAHVVDDAAGAALELAARSGTVVSVTGAVDLVTDGTRSVRIHNGDPLLGRITGSGCAATAVMGAFLGAVDDAFLASVAGLLTFEIAGERAASGCPGPGSYVPRLLDGLAEIGPDEIRASARIEG